METIQPSEMVRGGVYTYKSNEEHYIFRFIELEDFKVWAKESIDCLTDLYEDCKGYFNANYTFKKATPKEVKWLEVCEQENKFINKKTALEMEEKDNFKFKVGDKIQFKNWSNCTCIEILSLKGERENNFTGIDANNKVDGTYIKNDSWELYKEPKQKIKLQKFYCYDMVDDEMGDEGVSIKLHNDKDFLSAYYSVILTEKEFLEQFEIIK